MAPCDTAQRHRDERQHDPEHAGARHGQRPPDVTRAVGGERDAQQDGDRGRRAEPRVPDPEYRIDARPVDARFAGQRFRMRERTAAAATPPSARRWRARARRGGRRRASAQGGQIAPEVVERPQERRQDERRDDRMQPRGKRGRDAHRRRRQRAAASRGIEALERRMGDQAEEQRDRVGTRHSAVDDEERRNREQQREHRRSGAAEARRDVERKEHEGREPTGEHRPAHHGLGEAEPA